jgi:hypothetical protein
MDAIELILSVVGFAIAIWQINKTKHVAEAARDSAAETVCAIRHINAVASIQEICGRTRDLLNLTREKKLRPAANAAFELRDGVARFRYHSQNAKLEQNETWENVIYCVGFVHERLETAAMIRRISGEEREKLVHEISRLHSIFSALASEASTFRISNANS